MAGFTWFVAGIAVGILNGIALWQTVANLQPGRIKRALVLTWSGALLRCFSVAVFLVAAVNQALSPGLWALAGFFLARLAWVGMIGLRAANTERFASKARG